MRGYVQCAKDGQREFVRVLSVESTVFCGFCGDLLVVNGETVKVEA